MTRPTLLPLTLLLLGLCAAPASAQITAPTLKVGLPPELQTEVARQVTVQPGRFEARMEQGRSTARVTFSLLSAVNTEVVLELSDSRLVNPAQTPGPIKLRRYQEQTVSLIATAPHSGTVRVRNTKGEVIASLPYEVAPAKTVNQSASLNYAPLTGRAGLSYSVSGVTRSPLDPRWSAALSVGLNTKTGDLSGSVSVSVNW